MNLRALPSWSGTLLLGALGGQLADWAGWPLPWLIGSLLVVIAARCKGWHITELPHGRQVGQWIVASAIGLQFTAEVLAAVLAHFPLVLAGALGTCCLSLIGIWLLMRSGIDRATAFFASLPGGASEMVNLARRHQAQPALVAAAHSLRLLLVVLVVPAWFSFSLPAETTPAPLAVDWAWLAMLLPAGGLLAWLWQRLGQPNPWMLGPLLLCATASVTFDLHLGLPAGAGPLGQWLIGCALGCQFDRAFFRRAPAFLARILVFTLLAMLVAACLAQGLAWLGGQDARSLALGMMPGGITELCLTAEALQLSVALVSALQVLRLLLVMFLAEPLFRCWQRHRPG